MTSIVQRLVLAAAAVVLTLTVLEVAIRWGDLFAAQRRAAEGAAGESRAAAVNFPGAILHPYLGYTQRPGTPHEPPPPEEIASFFAADAEALQRYERLPRDLRTTSINSQGFISHIPDYRQVDGDKYVIGVFGGSVADAFSGVLRLGLKSELAAAVGVSEDAIEVLNFAKIGYRQPQQIIALTAAVLMEIPLDLVVNLDGFNEVALGGIDCEAGYDPLFPSTLQYLPLMSSIAHRSSPAAVESIVRLQRLRERESFLRGAARLWPLRSLETAKAALGALIWRSEGERLVVEQDLRMEVIKPSDPEVPVLLSPRNQPEKSCGELTAENWQRSSSLMGAIAAAAGASYLHLLQPNQYVDGSKPLSPEELASAWSPELPAAKAARAGYPLLRRRVEALRERGVNAIDLTGIFAEVVETVYVDQCCHLNYRGNRLLLQGMAPAVAKIVAQRRDLAQNTRTNIVEPHPQ